MYIQSVKRQARIIVQYSLIEISYYSFQSVIISIVEQKKRVD